MRTILLGLTIASTALLAGCDDGTTTGSIDPASPAADPNAVVIDPAAPADPAAPTDDPAAPTDGTIQQ